MFSTQHKALALEFSHLLSQRNYRAAYTLCSAKLQTQISIDQMKKLFEQMIPLDWGPVDPIMTEEGDGNLPFIYVVLGGDTYSEAIIIESFIMENGKLKINLFQFGRP
jgi:hypothetical protein